jgi:lipopolysaccharide export system protein LptA
MRILLTVLLSFLGVQGYSQPGTQQPQKRIIEIVQADVLEGIETDSAKIRKLLGNVILRNEDVLLHCDSAYHFFERNYLDAFGHVVIEKGDSIRLTGDTLRYFGDKRTANIKGKKVVLTQADMRLTTTALFYDLQNNFGQYTTGGELHDGKATLTSKIGYYYARTRDAFFRDSVILRTDEYTLRADTLQYNTATQTTFFHGPTSILTDQNIITCNGGWYDTERDVAMFKDDVHLRNPPQEVSADSLYYDRNLRFGKTYSDVVMRDTDENTMILCDYGEYDERAKSMMATERPVLINISEGDSIFITADTLRSTTDTNEVRKFRAYNHVRLFKSDLQGVCDSMSYSEVDSLLRLYNVPILWTDSSQFSADTITVMMVDNRVRQVNLYRDAIIGSITDSLIHNQIKGLRIHGFFSDDTLRRMVVEGNGESIYFAQDESEAYIGMNKATCARMMIYMKAAKVDRITFIGAPEATLTPMRDVDLKSYSLEGFSWREGLRPREPFTRE